MESRSERGVLKQRTERNFSLSALCSLQSLTLVYPDLGPWRVVLILSSASSAANWASHAIFVGITAEGSPLERDVKNRFNFLNYH